MINPPELPINDKARNDGHIASTGVRLYAAVLAHTQGGLIKKRNGKLVIHQRFS